MSTIENERRLKHYQQELDDLKENKAQAEKHFDKLIAEVKEKIIGVGDWTHTREVLCLPVFTFHQLRSSLAQDIRYQRKMGRYKSEEYMITGKGKV